MVVALGVILTRSPPMLAGTNSVSLKGNVGVSEHDVSACQAGETVPSGTSAIRLAMSAIIGPHVSAAVLSGSQILTSGTHSSGWTGAQVTVPVAQVTRTLPDATVCFALGDFDGKVEVVGEPTLPNVAAFSPNGQRLKGRFRVEYVRAGSVSWLSLASSIADHLDLGRTPSGRWVAFLAAALLLSLVALTSLLIVRELR